MRWLANGTSGLRDAAIAEAVAQIDEGRIRRHIETISGFGPRCEATPDGLIAALAYLRNCLRKWGYEPDEETCAGSTIQVNLIAEVSGSGRESNHVVEIGAHYDTVPGSPGADDNASALAGLLEIARILSGLRPSWTIRLCFFGQEEEHVHEDRGSYAHVKRIMSRDEKFYGIFVLEMIGYFADTPNSQRVPMRIPLILSPPRTGNFICLFGNRRSVEMVTRLERAARRHVRGLKIYSIKRLGALLQDGARSDHVPYWKAGKRAVMITDTGNFRNPNYHKSSDTAETVDCRFCGLVTQAVAATVLELTLPSS